jgi:hypothetical protein
LNFRNQGKTLRAGTPLICSADYIPTGRMIMDISIIHDGCLAAAVIPVKAEIQATKIPA